MAQLELLFLELAGFNTAVNKPESDSIHGIHIGAPLSVLKPSSGLNTEFAEGNDLLSNSANTSLNLPQTAPLNAKKSNLSSDTFFSSAANLGALFRHIRTSDCLPALRRAIDVEIVKPYLEMLAQVESETLFTFKQRLVQNEDSFGNTSDAECFAGLAAFYKLKSCWHEQFTAVETIMGFNAASVYDLVSICRENNIASPRVLAFATKLADEEWRQSIINSFCGHSSYKFDHPELSTLSFNRLGGIIRLSLLFTEYGESDAAKFSINGLTDVIDLESPFSAPFSTLEPFYDCVDKNTQILMALELPLRSDNLSEGVEKCTNNMHELQLKLWEHLAVQQAWKYLRTAQFFSAALFVDYFRDYDNKLRAWQRFNSGLSAVDFSRWPVNVFFSSGHIGVYNEISAFLEKVLRTLLSIGFSTDPVLRAYTLIYTKLWQNFQFLVHEHLDFVKTAITHNKDLNPLDFEAEATELKQKLLVNEPWVLGLLESSDFESLQLACQNLAVHPFYSSLDWTL